MSGGFGHFEGRPEGHPHAVEDVTSLDRWGGTVERRRADNARWRAETEAAMAAEGFPVPRPAGSKGGAS